MSDPFLSDGKRLWMDDSGARFWLIPDGSPPPDGPFPIRTALGARRSVDAAALAPFSISTTEADTRALAMVTGAFDALTHGAAAWLAPAGFLATELHKLEHTIASAFDRLFHHAPPTSESAPDLSSLVSRLRAFATHLASNPDSST